LLVGSARRGRKRYRVLGYDAVLIDQLAMFYEALLNLGGNYRFYCRGGRCWSIIEGGEDIEALVVSTPGLRVEECRGSCGESTVLLPPPPAPVPPRPLAAPSGPVVLGESGGVRVGLGEYHLWMHMGVFGATGSGKSHTAARIVRCAVEVLEVAGLVLDWHNEYYRLVRGARVLSGSKLPPVPLLSDAMSVDEAVGAMEQVLELTRNQSIILTVLLTAAASRSPEAAEAVLTQLFGDMQPAARKVAQRLIEARDMSDLLKAALEAYRLRALEAPKGELEAWAALIRRIALLGLDDRYSRLFLLDTDDATLPLTEGEATIIDLSSILNPSLRRLYAMLLLESIYAHVQQGAAPPLIAVIEEAHNFAETRTLLHLLTEARKYRLGLIIVTPTPRVLPNQALANLNTLIVHRIVSPEDLRALDEVLPAARHASISRLPSGMALMHTVGLEEPVLVKVASPSTPCG